MIITFLMVTELPLVQVVMHKVIIISSLVSIFHQGGLVRLILVKIILLSAEVLKQVIMVIMGRFLVQLQ